MGLDPDLGLRLRLPPPGLLSPNNAVDPLRFYYRPIVGRIFRARLQIGLDLIPVRSPRLLEVGYGSGLLLPTLAAATGALYGVDREPAPPALLPTLAQLGVHPRGLVCADVTALPFPDAFFQGAVAFSILEHLRRPALLRACRELARVIAPGGYLLVGCPAVHRAMNAAFAAIGFRGIEDHHFSSIRDVLAACAPDFRCTRAATWPAALGTLGLARSGLAPYTATLLVRNGPGR